MLIRHLSRPRSSFRQAIKCASCLAPTHPACQQSRNLLTLPPLRNDELVKAEGIPGVLSPEGVDMAWTQYQSLMLERINEMTAETEDENVAPKDLLLKTARDPARAAIFNHASMAFNNHFFFMGLSTSSSPGPIPTQMKKDLEESFSSMDTLRLELVATANAMFGPGFVWLVKARLPSAGGERYRILPTYLAGSPLSGAHWRQQSVDMNTQSRESLGGINIANSKHTEVQNNPGVIGPYSQSGAEKAKIAPGGVNAIPVLCVNTWEHVWLRDWGVQGKKDFLEAWWTQIDWEVAANMAQVHKRRPGFES